MIKTLLVAVLIMLSLTTCKKEDSSSSGTTSSGITTKCGTYKSGQQLYKGPEGGCYYYNKNGKKTYVERGACNC
ncbi:MAG: hypothetical protein ABIP95_09240 [Pelobium sp.]